MNIDTLKDMLNKGQDSLVLRFGLGQALLKQGQPLEAIEHFTRALEFNPDYSAAWKLLAKSLAESQQKQQAIDAYQKGIEVAETNGDIQAAKEMRVFLRRLLK